MDLTSEIKVLSEVFLANFMIQTNSVQVFSPTTHDPQVESS